MTVSKHSSLSLLTKRTATKRSHASIGCRGPAAHVMVEVIGVPQSSPDCDSDSDSGMKRIVSFESSSSSRSETVVSFQDTVQVFNVQPVDASLKNELFYSKKDYHRFKQESKRISSLLDQRLSVGASPSSAVATSSSPGRSSKNARFAAQKASSLAALRKLLKL